MEDLEGTIKKTICVEGPIPFARFMEMALYSPGLGYYTSGQRRTGVYGDYYTSPQAHPVFSALLALQLERMWQVIGRPKTFHVVEAGAGEGQLAQDILGYSRRLEEGFQEALVYIATDVSFGGTRVGEVHFNTSPLLTVASRGLPFHNLRGCILSNELMDAFPVHRLVVQEGTLKEIYVTLAGNALVEVLGEVSVPISGLLDVQMSLPPEGSTLEICPQVWEWMAEAARALTEGFLLTIDYGYWNTPKEGTVTSYRRHSMASPYERVGQQDLTAHVDFGAVMEAGRRVGLTPLGLVSQRRFLMDLGLGTFKEAAARLRLPQRQHQANQMAMLDLARPEGLGSFGVMIQYKGELPIFMGDLALERQVKDSLSAGDLPAPLLSREHIPLVEGRYPHLAWEY